MIRRRRFAEVIARQLELFEREHAGHLADCEAAERAYDAAPREELTWDRAAAAHLELYRELA